MAVVTTSRGRFVPDEVAQQRHRKNGGQKTPAVTTAEQWDAAKAGVIARLKAFLAARDADTPNNTDEDGEGE